MLKSFYILTLAALATPVLAQWSTPVKGPGGHYFSLRITRDQHDGAARRASESNHNGAQGFLAKVDTEAKRDWIYLNYANLNPGYVLIGGYRKGNGSNPAVGWLWDGTTQAIEMGLKYWVFLEPNNFRGNEDVLAMNFAKIGRFEDVSRNGTYYYLVEYIR